MVIKDGHTVQQCCKCQAIRQIHLDHADEVRRADYSSYFAPLGQYVRRWGCER